MHLQGALKITVNATKDMKEMDSIALQFSSFAILILATMVEYAENCPSKSKIRQQSAKNNGGASVQKVTKERIAKKWICVMCIFVKMAEVVQLSKVRQRVGVQNHILESIVKRKMFATQTLAEMEDRVRLSKE